MIINPNQHQQRVSSSIQQENMSNYKSNQSTNGNINPEQYMSPQQFQYQMGLDKKKIFCQSPAAINQQQTQNNRVVKDAKITNQSSDIRRIPTSEYLFSKQSQEDTRAQEKGNLNGQNLSGQNNQWEQNYQLKFPLTNSIQQKFKIFEVQDISERSNRHEINETKQIQNKIDSLNSIQDKFKIQLQYKQTASNQSSPLEGFKMSPKNNQINYSHQNQHKDLETKAEQCSQNFNSKIQKVDQNNILKDSKQVNVFNKEQQNQSKITGMPPNPLKINFQQQFQQKNETNGCNVQQPQTPSNPTSQLNNQQTLSNLIKKPPIDQNSQLLINNPNQSVNDFKMNHLMFKNNPLNSGEVKLVRNINGAASSTTPKESNNKNEYTTQNSLNNIDFKISSISSLQQSNEKLESSTQKSSLINKIDLGKPLHKATKSIFNTSSTTAQIQNNFNQNNERRSFHSNTNLDINNKTQQATKPLTDDNPAQIQQSNSVQQNNNILQYNQKNNNQQSQQVQNQPTQSQQNVSQTSKNSSQQQLQKNPSQQQTYLQQQKQSDKQIENTLKYSNQIPVKSHQIQSNQHLQQQHNQQTSQQSQCNTQQHFQNNTSTTNNNKIYQPPTCLSSNNIQLNQQNSIKTPASNQSSLIIKEEFKNVDNKYKQGSAEKPQTHLNSLSKIAPKNITDQQGGGPNSHKYNIDLNSVKNVNNKPNSAHNLKFPQPSHYDRDSFKSKRSSVQSQTGRSDLSSINNEIMKTQNNNNNSNNNYDSLNYEKISQQNDKSTFLDQIKEMSDNFLTKTQQFFQSNFKKINSRLGCSCDLNLKADGTCSNAYQWLFKHYSKDELDKLKKSYESIKNSQIPDMEQCMIQIEKDLSRTFPSLEMFQNEKYINQLRNLLQAVAKFDPNIGYVQGMNMIGASLLYHAEEYISFWIMQFIFEKLEMRDIYMPQLPGLSKHIQLIDFITLTRLPDLYSHFCQQTITFDMFCSPWIFSLFGVVLTPQKLTILFTELLEEGWLMFYKLVIAFLCYHKEFLFQQDMGEMLVTLTQDNYKFDSLEQWELLIKYAKNVNIDSNFINSMLESYDHEKKQFIMKHR